MTWLSGAEAPVAPAVVAPLQLITVYLQIKTRQEPHEYSGEYKLQLFFACQEVSYCRVHIVQYTRYISKLSQPLFCGCFVQFFRSVRSNVQI